MQNKHILKIVVIILITITFTGCIHRLRFKTEPSVRVLLYDGIKSMTLSSDDNIIVEANGMKGESPSYAVWQIEYKGGILSARIGSKYVKGIGDCVEFYSKHPWGTVYFGGRGYKGIIEFRVLSGKAVVINNVPIEAYLKGVVPYEIGNLNIDKIEAIKAQAVAARTYVIRKLTNSRNKYYYVYNDIRDQVYRGVMENSNVVDMACDATRGIILTYKNKPIDAKYSSCCGGVTADARELWTDKKVPYLTPVIDAKSYLIFKGKPFCSNSRYSHWTIKYSKGELFGILKKNLSRLTGKSEDEIGNIKSIVITKRGPSRRVIEVIVYTSAGEFSVEKNNIRMLLKNNSEPSKSLPSTLFTMEMGGDSIKIIGRGYGHGAGMCQYGAMGMAEKGYNYKDILRHYYRGVHLEKIY
ncbi:MAG: SpoIID/LytB domain-containing protein [Proteobacteria bacterium]|nr:SpoIID/LytB domain-containing protein [Pseudomonadota bacterium]